MEQEAGAPVGFLFFPLLARQKAQLRRFKLGIPGCTPFGPAKMRLFPGLCRSSLSSWASCGSWAAPEPCLGPLPMSVSPRKVGLLDQVFQPMLLELSHLCKTLPPTPQLFCEVSRRVEVVLGFWERLEAQTLGRHQGLCPQVPAQGCCCR